MAVGLQASCFSPGKASRAEVDWTRPGRAHLVGIGGSGMRALARVLSQRGWSVSGSDVATAGLAAVLPKKTLLSTGHSALGLPRNLDVVVHSDAIGSDNPELQWARSLGVATASYFDAVGQLMHRRRGLAVAGTHGKSTTTAMAAWILVQSGYDPTILCGAATLGRSDGGRAGRSPVVLAEACEYRANFLKLRPRSAVILGIEPDHFDCYADLAEAEHAFGQFAAAIPHDGLLLARADCEATRRAIAGATCRVETFGVIGQTPRASRPGFGTGRASGTHTSYPTDAPLPTAYCPLPTACDWSARPIDRRRGRYRFELLRRGRVLCRLALRMAGRHNMLNALAAAALAAHQGVEPRQIADALGRFPGVRRRLEPVGTWRGVRVVDDFAHHPTELTAALTTVHQMHPDRRVCCVFQPHQVSRTTRLLDELAESLHNGLRGRRGPRRGDRLWIAEIFRAREPGPAPGEVTSADLADRVRDRGHEVAGVHAIDDIRRDLRHHLQSGDVLLTIGAGDIRRILGGLFPAEDRKVSSLSDLRHNRMFPSCFRVNADKLHSMR